MLRFFIIFLIAIILASGGIWLFSHPGIIHITWLGYKSTASVFVGILSLLALLLALFITYRFVAWVFGLPLRWKNTWKTHRDEKSNIELIHMAEAIAAQNGEDALFHQKKLNKAFKKSPLALWYTGQLFELVEKPLEAEKCYITLQNLPEGKFLGLKGQISAAMKRQDWSFARELLEKARDLREHSPWVLTTLLSVMQKLSCYKEAEHLVDRLDDLGHLPEGDAKKELARLQLKHAMRDETGEGERESLLRQSHYLDPGLDEATFEFSKILKKQGHLKYAKSAIEATWAFSPTQALGDLYVSLYDPETPLKAYEAAQTLAKTNKAAPETALLLGHYAIQAKLWGEARKTLIDLCKKNPSAQAYALLAHLEMDEHNDIKAAHGWLEKGIAL